MFLVTPTLSRHFETVQRRPESRWIRLTVIYGHICSAGGGELAGKLVPQTDIMSSARVSDARQNVRPYVLSGQAASQALLAYPCNARSKVLAILTMLALASLVSQQRMGNLLDAQGKTPCSKSWDRTFASEIGNTFGVPKTSMRAHNEGKHWLKQNSLNVGMQRGVLRQNRKEGGMKGESRRKTVELHSVH